MKNRRSYYRILHVQRDAPAEVIRSSYRTMMQKLKMHPDLGGDHSTAALVNEAFAVLNDPDSRKRYDADMAASDDSSEYSDESQNPTEDTVEAENAETDSVGPENVDEQCLFCFAQCRPTQFRDPADVCSGCGGPLYPAEQRRFEADRQRAIERIPKQTRASIRITPALPLRHHGWVQDISLNGMQLRTAFALTEGQIVIVGTGVLDAVARVVDTQRAPPGDVPAASWRAGLAFLTLKIHRSRGAFVSIDA